jgi:hypothetical protein
VTFDERKTNEIPCDVGKFGVFLKPNVSVILPVRNEEKRIRRCVESLFAQNYPHGDFELLVVDGMSEDKTRDRLAALQTTMPNLRVIDNPEKIVTAALNIAIANARGDHIIRCDAHAEYARDYIASCIRVVEKTDAANVGGHMRALSSENSAVARAIALAHYSRFGLGGGKFHDPAYEGYVDTVWLGCYKKEVFEKIGGYNGALPRSEDIDLNCRLRKAGMRCYLSPGIKAYYYCRPNLGALFMQRWSDGMGVVRMLPVNAPAIGVRHLVPLAFVVSLIALCGLSFLKAGRAALVIEAALYGAASLYFSAAMFITGPKTIRAFTEGVATVDDKKYRGAALLLPLVFGTLHFSYGLGSLYALCTLPGFVKEYRRGMGGSVEAGKGERVKG